MIVTRPEINPELFNPYWKLQGSGAAPGGGGGGLLGGGGGGGFSQPAQMPQGSSSGGLLNTAADVLKSKAGQEAIKQIKGLFSPGSPTITPDVMADLAAKYGSQTVDGLMGQTTFGQLAAEAGPIGYNTAMDVAGLYGGGTLTPVTGLGSYTGMGGTALGQMTAPTGAIGAQTAADVGSLYGSSQGSFFPGAYEGLQAQAAEVAGTAPGGSLFGMPLTGTGGISGTSAGGLLGGAATAMPLAGLGLAGFAAIQGAMNSYDHFSGKKSERNRIKGLTMPPTFGGITLPQYPGFGVEGAQRKFMFDLKDRVEATPEYKELMALQNAEAARRDREAQQGGDQDPASMPFYDISSMPLIQVGAEANRRGIENFNFSGNTDEEIAQNFIEKYRQAAKPVLDAWRNRTAYGSNKLPL